MFSMTKSKVLCEVQTPFSLVATGHSEEVNINPKKLLRQHNLPRAAVK